MNKEQKETIALIVIIISIIIAACVMLVIKPKIREIGEIKKSIRKVNSDIEKQRKHSKQLIELNTKKETCENNISANESNLFGGITVGDLSEVISTVARSNFSDLKLNYLGDRAEVLPGGIYNELTNEVKIQTCDFHEVVKFISALEMSNQGLRITNIELESASSKPEGDGNIIAGMEIKLLGLHDGKGIPSEWEPPKTPAYYPGEQRNPFGEGGIKKVDPELEFKTKAKNIKVTMITSDSIWVKDLSVPNSGARECLVKKIIPVFEPRKIRLLSINEDYFIIRRDDGKIFKMIVRQANETIGNTLYERGTISEVIQLK